MGLLSDRRARSVPFQQSGSIGTLCNLLQGTLRRNGSRSTSLGRLHAERAFRLFVFVKAAGTIGHALVTLTRVSLRASVVAEAIDQFLVGAPAFLALLKRNCGQSGARALIGPSAIQLVNAIATIVNLAIGTGFNVRNCARIARHRNLLTQRPDI